MIDSAVATAHAATKLKFGYVPFTMNVNIGASNAAYVDGFGDPLFAGTSWAGCVQEFAPPEHVCNKPVSAKKYRTYISTPETNVATSCENAGDGFNTGYALVEQSVGGAPLRRGTLAICSTAIPSNRTTRT